MPVRFQHGIDSLGTAANTILHGAATATLSFWARLNAVNGTANGISLFKKQFSQDFQNVRPNTFANKIRVQWLGVNGTPSWDQSMILSAAYHFFLCWQGGTQNFYVNGDLVSAASVAGALAAQASGRTIQLGQGSAGLDDLDFTVDDPAIWVGYFGSAQDAVNLRDRTVDPTGVSPANLVWYCPLDGTAGAACQAGDAGLVNQGTAGSAQNLGTITGSPVYDGTPLVFKYPTQLTAAVVGPSGESVDFTFEDLNGAPTNLSAINTAPTISVNGGPPVTLANPVWGSSGLTAQPWLYYPLAGPVLPADSVTFTAPQGWVTTAAGTIGPSAAQALANKVNGSLLPAFTPGGKTTGAGYNLQRLRYYNPVPYYANTFEHAGNWIATNTGQGVTTLNADGTLASLPAGGAFAVVSLCDVGYPTGRGYPGQPPGTWTLVYDGDGTASLGVVGSYAALASVTRLSNTFTGTTNNTSTFNITRAAGQYFVAVQLNVTSLGTTGVNNIRVYPPGIATDGSQKFHPQFLRMLTGTRCIRFMEVLETNGNTAGASTVVNFADFMPATQSTYGTARPYTPTLLTGISAPVVNIWETTRTPCQLTTATPHGLADGQVVTFSSDCPGFNTSTGATTLALFQLAVHVIDATTFQVAQSTSHPGTVSGSQGYGGSISAAQPPGMPVADVVDLCNQVGADLWINIPTPASDVCVNSLADYIAANLGTGRKVRVEWANEVWNSSFPTFEWAYAAAQLDGTLPGVGYQRQQQWAAKQARHVHTLFRTRFSAAGRPTTDVIRVLGSQLASTTFVATGLDYAATQGWAYDEVCVAPYWEDAENSAAWVNVYGARVAGFTVDQLHDLTQLWLRYGLIPTWLANHYAVIAARAASFPGLRLTCYEGGPQAVRGVTVSLSQVWGRHPRIVDSYLFLLDVVNNPGAYLNGVAQGTPAAGVFCHFDLGDTDGTVYQAADANWPAFLGAAMLAGAGDGTDGRTDNRVAPLDLDTLVGVIPHTLDVWNGVADPGAVAALPPVPITDVYSTAVRTSGRWGG